MQALIIKENEFFGRMPIKPAVVIISITLLTTLLQSTCIYSEQRVIKKEDLIWKDKGLEVRE